MHYPGTIRMEATEIDVSSGCEWLSETNPFTGKPFGTREQFSRCIPAEEVVPGRRYNPVQRPWYRDFALRHGNISWYGPYKAVGTGVMFMSLGSGIFDRLYVWVLFSECLRPLRRSKFLVLVAHSFVRLAFLTTKTTGRAVSLEP